MGKAHATIGLAALARHGDWSEADANDPHDLYDLRYVRSHLEAAGLSERMDEIALKHQRRCRDQFFEADSSHHHQIALDLVEQELKFLEPAVTHGSEGLADLLAGALMNEGKSLNLMRRLPQALASYVRAIEIWERLVHSGRLDLENALAWAIVGRAATLSDVGQFDEAMATHDRGIEILERLIQSGRGELAKNLAFAVMNRGSDLSATGRLPEALASLNLGIKTLEQLVQSGREELANALATALANRGVILTNLGQLLEALASYDQAIEIQERLIRNGRLDLDNDLSSSVMNMGIALSSMGKLSEALAAYDRGIEIWERLVDSGAIHLFPRLLRALRLRSQIYVRLSQWSDAAGDLKRFLVFSRTSSAPARDARIARESNSMAKWVRSLGPEELEPLCEHLEDWAPVVRGWVAPTS